MKRINREEKDENMIKNMKRMKKIRQADEGHEKDENVMRDMKEMKMR